MKHGDEKYNYEVKGAKNSTRALGYSIKMVTVKNLAKKRAEVQKRRELKELEIKL